MYEEKLKLIEDLGNKIEKLLSNTKTIEESNKVINSMEFIKIRKEIYELLSDEDFKQVFFKQRTDFYLKKYNEVIKQLEQIEKDKRIKLKHLEISKQIEERC